MEYEPAAGELNRRISIKLQSDAPTSNPAGTFFGLQTTYANVCTVWARKRPVHGLQLRSGANTSDAPTDFFYVRYGALTKPGDLSVNHVVEMDGRRYRVLDSIDVNDANRFTRISVFDLGPIA